MNKICSGPLETGSTPNEDLLRATGEEEEEKDNRISDLNTP